MDKLRVGVNAFILATLLRCRFEGFKPLFVGSNRFDDWG